jgi:predicted RNase H-like HicB family nuclease
MIDEQLMREAMKLASRPYTVSYETDTLVNGEHVYLLRNPELPAVKAQGESLEEANQNLEEARTDYIYSLLEDGLPVPEPATSASTGSSANGQVWTIRAKNDGNETQAPAIVVVTLGGDLVKQS